MSALSRRKSHAPIEHRTAQGPAQDPRAAQSMMGNAFLQEQLAAAFRRPLGGLDATFGEDEENEAMGADASTQGTSMSFASDVSPDASDPESVEVIAHETAHALAGGGSGEDEVDQPGDPGEAAADRAGEEFRAWAEDDFTGEAPVLAPAAGGRAEVHRHPTSSGGLTGSPMLRQGSTGALVKTLQRLLNALGYGLDVDGDFGPETDRAVRGFQAKNGLDADGVVGPMTAGALNSGGSSSEESSESEGGGGGGGGADGAVLTGNPMLREGSDGTLVKELQKLLNEHGASLVVDGDFGPQTASAVRSFQSVNGLVADGVVGPLTASKLNSAGAKDIGSGGGVGGGKNEDDAPPESDPKSVSEWRDRVLSAAESHLGAPYYWGADGPNMFDCSGFVLYVLRQDTGLVNWGDDTAAGIQGRLPKTSRPEQGDLVFYAGSGGAAHVEMVVGGTSEIGCSGGGSSTFGNNPNAKVQYGDMTADSRSRSYGSIKGLIDAKIAGAKA